MSGLAQQGSLAIAGASLEYRMIGPSPDKTPTIVLLHEGLGSMALWGEFPDRLSAATGAGVFVYSRQGYGASSPVSLPRSMHYMHTEALEIMPQLLDAIGFRRGILLGHSDGASIATIYAGGIQDHRIRGLCLIAPHFIVEDCTIAAIRDAKQAYATGDLKAKLSRHHKDVEGAFRGWNDAWLSPDFRRWDISESLGYIRVPIQIIQGKADPYGTERQIRIAEEECYCPVDAVLMNSIGHSPHKEAADQALKTASDFANRILTLHGEGQFV